MKKSLLALVLALSLYSMKAFGGTPVHIGGAQVNHIHHASGATLIKLDGMTDNPAGCVSNFWYSISRTDPMHDDYLRLALSALASGKVLTIWLDDTDCQFNTPLVVAMTINRV